MLPSCKGWKDWTEGSKKSRDFQSFDEGFGFMDFLDWIEDFFQPLPSCQIPSAPAELGRQWNSQYQSQPNLT